MKTVVMILCFQLFGIAQNSDRSMDDAANESLLDDISENDDLQYRGEELEYLRTHPVNVCHPSYGDLLRIPSISPLLAESIILYTDTVRIEDIEQLKNAALITPALFDRIAPFITADEPGSDDDWSWLMPGKIESRSRIEQRLQTTKGFADHTYIGSPFSSYQRFRMENSHFEFAAMAEKDAGESINDGYLAGYAEVKKISIVDDLILGNYSAGASQGLVLAKNIAAAKGSDAAGQIRKRGSFITPSVSTDEFRYFSGAAFRVTVSGLSFTGLHSVRNLPAVRDSNGTVTSFYTAGLYRNQNEINRRKRLSEQMTGGIIEYAFNGSAAVTLTAMRVLYGADLHPSLLSLDDQRTVTAGSIGWDIPLYGLRSFGEIAGNDISLVSSVAGFIVPIARTLSFSYHHRSYSKGYAAPFARPFGERFDIGDGEFGDYLGLELRLGRTTASAYIDQYELPSNDHTFSIYGKESFVHLIQPLSDRTEITLQIKNGIRTSVSEQSRTNYRIGYSYRLSRNWTIAQRYEHVKADDITAGTSETGFMTFVDCHFNDRQLGLVIRSRMVWFQSPSYDTRSYQYEPDVPGNFSNPPLYGTGLRWFLLARYDLFDGCSIGLKYSETKKLHERVLGSGDDIIIGNLDSRVAFQADFRF